MLENSLVGFKITVAYIFSVIACVFWLGCASGPQLEDYSRTELERPYTLPKGVATWRIPTLFGKISDESDSVTLYPIPIPLVWEQSLSDDLNLIWYPLPLGLAKQFLNSEKNRIGLTLLTGFSFGSTQGFRLQPGLYFSYRHRFSDNLGWDIGPTFKPDIPFDRNQEFYWTAGISTGPLFQMTETFMIKPIASFSVTRGRGESDVFGFEEFSPSLETTATLGIGLSAVWSMSRQWDVRPSYQYSGFISNTNYESHIGNIEFVHFW